MNMLYILPWCCMYCIMSVAGLYELGLRSPIRLLCVSGIGHTTLCAVCCTVMCWHECVRHPISWHAKCITWWEALCDIASHDLRVWSTRQLHAPWAIRCISEGMAQLATMRGQHSIASGSSLRQEVLACRAYPHLPVSAISPLSTHA